MSRLDIPIIVVDDARFSNTVIGKTVRSGGYSNVRHASSASEALKLMEEAPADILIADWLMPEMDGLALTQRVRQIDETGHHYTYVILLTAKEGPEALSHAFDEGVDDFVNKSDMSDELLPRLHGAQRAADYYNRLLNENRRLLNANQRLNSLSTIDSLTGLGNLRYALSRLRDTLKQIQGRNAAACLFLIRMVDYPDLEKRFSRTITDQISIGVARRLRQIVRPLDTVARIQSEEFVIVLHMEDSSQFTPSGFRRFYEALSHKEYKTGAGFLPARVAMAALWVDNKTGVPDGDALIQQTRELLVESEHNQQLVIRPFRMQG